MSNPILYTFALEDNSGSRVLSLVIMQVIGQPDKQRMLLTDETTISAIWVDDFQDKYDKEFTFEGLVQAALKPYEEQLKPFEKMLEPLKSQKEKAETELARLQSKDNITSPEIQKELTELADNTTKLTAKETELNAFPKGGHLTLITQRHLLTEEVRRLKSKDGLIRRTLDQMRTEEQDRLLKLNKAQIAESDKAIQDKENEIKGLRDAVDQIKKFSITGKLQVLSKGMIFLDCDYGDGDLVHVQGVHPLEKPE